jgi:hypothetical protein
MGKAISLSPLCASCNGTPLPDLQICTFFFRHFEGYICLLSPYKQMLAFVMEINKVEVEAVS